VVPEADLSSWNQLHWRAFRGEEDMWDAFARLELQTLSSDLLLKHTQHSVQQHPQLCQAVDKSKSSYTVLARAISGALNEQTFRSGPIGGQSAAVPSIQYLIEQNPYALIWPLSNGMPPIRFIAGEFWDQLLLWIVENFSFILDMAYEGGNPPVHASLLEAYSTSPYSRQVPAQAVRNYFEAYPQGLQQKNYAGRLPLHLLCKCYKRYRDARFREDDILSLIQFMLEAYPEAASQVDSEQWTPLHHACNSLRSFTVEDPVIVQICMLLLDQYPHAALLKDIRSRTPLEFIARFSGHSPSLPPVIAALLRVQYPKPLSRHAGRNPLVQETHAMIKEEAVWADNCVRIKRVSTMLHSHYVTTTTNSLSSNCNNNAYSYSAKEIDDIYSTWAADTLAAMNKHVKNFREVEMPRAWEEFQEPEGDEDEDDNA
jgi:hypothetical protein